MNRFIPAGKPAAGLVLALVVLFGSPVSARADVIQSFDTPVATGNTQAPGVWYRDRYNPAVFTSPSTAPDGRNGTLRQGISGSDFQGPGSFYNTQGRKYDLPGGTVSAQIQLYVPSSWDSLDQSVSGSGRLAGFWGTAFDSSNAISAYPIIEFNNDTDGQGTDGFRVYNVVTGDWINVSGFTGYDQWYNLGIDLLNGNVDYYVNGSLVGSVASNGSETLGNVILQGYNAGNDYNINWDNLSASDNHIPEPATLALFGLGGLAVFAYRFRRPAAA